MRHTGERMNNKRSYSFLFPLAVILLLPACQRAAAGPFFQPLESRSPEKAVVYIYRPLASRILASDYHSPYLLSTTKRSFHEGRLLHVDLRGGRQTCSKKATTLFVIS
jgi:hypothetical protein